MVIIPVAPKTTSSSIPTCLLFFQYQLTAFLLSSQVQLAVYTYIIIASYILLLVGFRLARRAASPNEEEGLRQSFAFLKAALFFQKNVLKLVLKLPRYKKKYIFQAQALAPPHSKLTSKRLFSYFLFPSQKYRTCRIRTYILMIKSHMHSPLY